MSKIKVLPLDFWMKNIDLRDSIPNIEEIPPVFKRDGYYKYREAVWFEFSGKAWIYPENNFDFELELLNYDRPLRPRERGCLQYLVKNGVIKSDRLYMDGIWHSCRNTYRMSRKYCMGRIKNQCP